MTFLEALEANKTQKVKVKIKDHAHIIGTSGFAAGIYTFEINEMNQVEKWKVSEIQAEWTIVKEPLTSYCIYNVTKKSFVYSFFDERSEAESAMNQLMLKTQYAGNLTKYKIIKMQEVEE